ncbi:MAG: nuclear transport factor 2 family protein [Deltaproteobacteria bacterium]|nr:nuclear transport factor 2 family protein [Deltaproteobacteria bacterium]
MASERRKLTKEGMGIREGIPLTVSDGGVDELRGDIQRLMDIEAIKQLKHAYFRCIDTANLEELETIFHEDVSVNFVGGAYEWKLEGRDEYLASLKSAFTREAIGHHNGHHPEIQILSETEATGIWYLADNMWVMTFDFFTTGTAIYWDRYLKVDGRWTIKDTSYERIYEMSRALEEKPPLVSHYLGVHGAEVKTEG